MTLPTRMRPTRTRRPRAQRGPRSYRRRRLAAAALAALVLVVGVGLGTRVLLYESGLAEVEGVEVRGAVTVPAADVVSAAAVENRVALAAVDTGAVAGRVAGLPEVAAVEVGRDWPHTVTVTVTERVPVAVAGSSVTQGDLVDSTGLAYAPPRGATDLPRLDFAPVAPGEPATVAALAVLGALPDRVSADLETVDVTASGQLVLGLTDDRRVQWGSAARSQEKAAVLVALLTQPGRTYDVASPELPTIRG